MQENQNEGEMQSARVAFEEEPIIDAHIGLARR